MKQIHILSIDSPLETQALRSVAEYWGATVSVTWVGNSQEIVDYLSRRPSHDLIVIAGHGDSRGLLLPELHDTIKNDYPFAEVIRPADFAQFVALNGSVVLNSSCCGGIPELVNVFLNNGASAYSGNIGHPDGDDALMYSLCFLYDYLVQDRSPVEAHRNANLHSGASFSFLASSS
jgi:hypothetical protein